MASVLYHFKNQLLPKLQNEGFLKNVNQFLEEWFDESKDYFEVKTSGSTGRPKTIKILKADAVKSAKITNSFFGLKENSKVLLCLSPKYIAGKMMLVRAIVGGYFLEIVPLDAYPLSHTSSEFDFAAMSTMQFKNSIDKTHKIRQILVGGASLKNILGEAKNIHCQLFESFGMTETITHCAIRKVLENDHFEALNGFNFSKNEENCLVINTPFSYQKVETKDVIELISEKKFIWKGRKDFVINSGGIKIYPEQIEGKLSKHLQKPFLIGRISDVYFGEKVVLFTEEDSLGKIEFENIFEKALTPFEKPKQIIRVKNLEKLTNGKVNRLFYFK